MTPNGVDFSFFSFLFFSFLNKLSVFGKHVLTVTDTKFRLPMWHLNLTGICCHCMRRARRQSFRASALQARLLMHTVMHS